MHLQNLLTLTVAALAGTSIAAEYNGGEIPSWLRQGRNKNRASLSASASSSEVASTPASSFAASSFAASSFAVSSSAAMRSEMPSSSMMMMMTMNVSPTPKSSSARPSPTTFVFHKASAHPAKASSSPSSSHRHSSSATIHGIPSSTPEATTADVQIDDLVPDDNNDWVTNDSDNDNDRSSAPFWNKPAPKKHKRPTPGGNAPINN